MRFYNPLRVCLCDDFSVAPSNRNPCLLYLSFMTKNTLRLAAIITAAVLSGNTASYCQSKDPQIIQAIVTEATHNSQLKNLAHELLDVISPRLTGTPQMKKANDWAVAKYNGMGIEARNEKWGEWRGWDRGVSHIDLVSPRVKSLEGTQLAWSPGTRGKTITAEVIILPEVTDSLAFKEWMPKAKGKFVLISMNQPTGRPDYNWQEFGTKESFDKMKKDRLAQTDAWRERIRKTGYTTRTLPRALDSIGAAGI